MGLIKTLEQEAIFTFNHFSGLVVELYVAFTSIPLLSLFESNMMMDFE